eukprot:TRINITY_DN12852_c0_g1_i2.p1 TRINITY_DN12852_c0_g1~~TRINITY_DN12852_c0_g1_i2.p1  ORF type:complete len:1659 (+),score=496.63 TRINITY_DN12852_c0_g1_i2:78-5054(+)
MSERPTALTRRLCEVRLHNDSYSTEDLLVDVSLFKGSDGEDLFSSPLEAPKVGAAGGKGVARRTGPRAAAHARAQRGVAATGRASQGKGDNSPDRGSAADTGAQRPALDSRTVRAWGTGWEYYFRLEPKEKAEAPATPRGSAGSDDSRPGASVVVRGCTAPPRVPFQRPCVSVHERLVRQCFPQPVPQQGGQCYVTPLAKGDWKSYELAHVEVTFIDAFLSRSDLWTLTHALRRCTVYRGKILPLRAQSPPGTMVRSMLAGDPHTQVCSGIISRQTKITLRSLSARIIWMFQLSSEMFLYSDDGDMYLQRAVDLLIRDVVKKWRSAGCKHNVMVVLFARVEQMSGAPGSAVADFFRVVCDVPGGDDHWDDVPKLMRRAVFRMINELRVVTPMHPPERWCCRREGCPRCGGADDKEPASDSASGNTGTPCAGAAGLCGHWGALSCALRGNVLEAINLALNSLARHHLDRSLVCTGQAVVVVTAGTGLFRAQWELSCLTRQRMIDMGTSCTLICLGRPPLHVAPCFEYDRDDAGGASVCGGVGIEPDSFYERVEWMNIRFYCRVQQNYGSRFAASGGCDLLTFDAALDMYTKCGQFLPLCRMPSARRMCERVMNSAWSTVRLEPYGVGLAPLHHISGSAPGGSERDDSAALSVPYEVVRWTRGARVETSPTGSVTLGTPPRTPILTHDSPGSRAVLAAVSPDSRHDPSSESRPRPHHARSLSGDAGHRRCNLSVPGRPTPGSPFRGPASPMRTGGRASPNSRTGLVSSLPLDDIPTMPAGVPRPHSVSADHVSLQHRFILPFDVPGPNTDDIWGNPDRAPLTGSPRLQPATNPARRQLGQQQPGPQPARVELADPYEAANSKRWAHVFPVVLSDCPYAAGPTGWMWKFMVEPALLPLTTPYFPTAEGGAPPRGYLPYPSCVPGNMISTGTVPCRPGKVGLVAFLHECIMQRLHQGYQQYVSDAPPRDCWAEETFEQTYRLSLGHQFQSISVDEQRGLDITRFLRKQAGAVTDRLRHYSTLTRAAPAATHVSSAPDVWAAGSASPREAASQWRSGRGFPFDMPRSFGDCEVLRLSSSFSAHHGHDRQPSRADAQESQGGGGASHTFWYRLYIPFSKRWDLRQTLFEHEESSRLVNWSQLDNLLCGSEDLAEPKEQGQHCGELIPQMYRARKVRFAVIPQKQPLVHSLTPIERERRRCAGTVEEEQEMQAFEENTPVQKLAEQICSGRGGFVLFQSTVNREKVKVLHRKGALTFNFPHPDRCRESVREPQTRELVLEQHDSRVPEPERVNQHPDPSEHTSKYVPEAQYAGLTTSTASRPLNACPADDSTALLRTPWLLFGAPLSAHSRCYFTMSMTWLACPLSKVVAFRDYVKRRVEGALGTGFKLVQVPFTLCGGDPEREGVDLWSPLRPYAWHSVHEPRLLSTIVKHLVEYQSYLPPRQDVTHGCVLLHSSGDVIIRVPGPRSRVAADFRAEPQFGLCFVNNPSVSWLTGWEDGPMSDGLKLSVPGLYEVRDDRGKWWPATLLELDGDRVTADVDDGHATRWRYLPRSHIRRKQGDDDADQRRGSSVALYETFSNVVDVVQILYDVLEAVEESSGLPCQQTEPLGFDYAADLSVSPCGVEQQLQSAVHSAPTPLSALLQLSNAECAAVAAAVAMVVCSAA